MSSITSISMLTLLHQIEFFLGGGGGGGGGLWQGAVNIIYKCLKWHFYSSRNTNVPSYSEIDEMDQTSSIYDHFII